MIDSCTGYAPVRRHGIACTNVDILSIGFHEISFSEIEYKYRPFELKMSSAQFHVPTHVTPYGNIYPSQ